MSTSRTTFSWLIVLFILLFLVAIPLAAPVQAVAPGEGAPSGRTASVPLVTATRHPGGRVPHSGSAQGWTGSEAFGSGNPSGKPAQRFSGQSVNTLSGNFSHTFTDISLTGRGLPLLLSRTYNAGAVSQNGPFGPGWSSSYTMFLSLQQNSVTITQENGSTVTFTSNGQGGYTAAPRVLATLVQNQDGSFTFTRLQGQTSYTFSASGQLTQETDCNGYLTTLSYQNGQLSTVTDQAGRTLTFTWTGTTITGVTDPIGRQVSFLYDQNGNLATVTDVNGGTTSFSYDTSHLLLSITDPNGGVLSSVYDTNSPPQVTAQTDAMKRTTTFNYGPNTTTTITDPNGNVAVDQYQNALLVSETHGLGSPQVATTTYSYAPSLGVTALTDPNGDVWSNTWDSRGNLLSAADPLGRITKYTYDSFNDVTSITDPLGEKTTLTYTTHGDLASTSCPLKGTKKKQTTINTYGDPQHPDDVTAMTDPDGQVWTSTYDTAGDQASVTDPLGDKTAFTYNDIGWKTAVVSPNGNTTSYTYDPFGQVA